MFKRVEAKSDEISKRPVLSRHTYRGGYNGWWLSKVVKWSKRKKRLLTGGASSDYGSRWGCRGRCAKKASHHRDNSAVVIVAARDPSIIGSIVKVKIFLIMRISVIRILFRDISWLINLLPEHNHKWVFYSRHKVSHSTLSRFPHFVRMFARARLLGNPAVGELPQATDTLKIRILFKNYKKPTFIMTHEK